MVTISSSPLHWPLLATMLPTPDWAVAGLWPTLTINDCPPAVSTTLDNDIVLIYLGSGWPDDTTKAIAALGNDVFITY